MFLNLWEVIELFKIERKLWTLAPKHTILWDACLTFREHTPTHRHTHARTPSLFHLEPRIRTDAWQKICTSSVISAREKQKQNVQLISQGLFGCSSVFVFCFLSVTSGQRLIKWSSEFGGYERTQASWERKDAIRMETFPWVVLAPLKHQQKCN